MKIGLNQPNGFTTLFANDPSKYLDQSSESNAFPTQILSMLEIDLILMSIMEVQS
jgi:hypothetical protein